MKLILTFSPCLAIAVLCGGGCQTAQVTSDVHLAPPEVSRPAIVYVADFELGVQTIQHEDGRLSGRPGPVGRIGSRLSGGANDPAARARQLVDLMANSLVRELAKAGFSSRRLSPGEPPGDQGWLVRGLFTEVQEGNRLRRAMIGFGEGQTDVQVVATVHDLAQGPPRPLYEIATDANSGDKVGAAPTLVLGPYGAAARFVMSGNDLEKSIKQTAAEIAGRLADRFQTAE